MTTSNAILVRIGRLPIHKAPKSSYACRRPPAATQIRVAGPNPNDLNSAPVHSPAVPALTRRIRELSILRPLAITATNPPLLLSALRFMPPTPLGPVVDPRKLHGDWLSLAAASDGDREYFATDLACGRTQHQYATAGKLSYQLPNLCPGPSKDLRIRSRPDFGEGDNPSRDAFKTKPDVVKFVQGTVADGAKVIRQQGDAGLNKTTKFVGNRLAKNSSI